MKPLEFYCKIFYPWELEINNYIKQFTAKVLICYQYIYAF